MCTSARARLYDRLFACARISCTLVWKERIYNHTTEITLSKSSHLKAACSFSLACLIASIASVWSLSGDRAFAARFFGSWDLARLRKGECGRRGEKAFVYQRWKHVCSGQSHTLRKQPCNLIDGTHRSLLLLLRGLRLLVLLLRRLFLSLSLLLLLLLLLRRGLLLRLRLRRLSREDLSLLSRSRSRSRDLDLDRPIRVAATRVSGRCVKNWEKGKPNKPSRTSRRLVDHS